jgi:hypothetical protein
VPPAGIEVALRLGARGRVAAGALAGRLHGVVEIGAPEGALDDRELEDAARSKRGVGAVAGVCIGRAKRPDHEVGGDEHEERPGDRDGGAAAEPAQDPGNREGREPGEGEVRDRQEPARRARVAERRDDFADSLVDRRVRAEREEDGDENRQAEQSREPGTAAGEDDEPHEPEDREQPPEVDEVLEPPLPCPVEEVGPGGLEALDLRERPPSRLRRIADHEGVHEEPAAHREERAHGRPGKSHGPEPDGRVAEHKRDRAEGEVHLAGERDGHEGEEGDGSPGVP